MTEETLTPESVAAESLPEANTTANSKPTLSDELLAKMDAYWHAANYLTVGQIYLKDNPLLKRPLTLEDVKPRLLGHWGTTTGLNFIYVHLNRVIRERDLNMIYIMGPGHGGPGIVANTYLEGSYTELYPAVEQNADGIKRLFRQFSWPLGIPSHVAPETPGSIHEGGELGYSLVHAYGAAFDNPDLVVACVVGDGEAETGPLATSWHSNKFLNPATDGAVIPILHLNGYKIANPTILARIPHEELENLMRGYGYEPFTLEGDDPAVMHQQAAAVFDTMLDRIAQIQKAAREEGGPEVVMACCGDVPTLEALAAVCLLRARIPDLRIRVVNVVDLMAWQPVSEHPHGLADEEFDRLFPVGTPIVDAQTNKFAELFSSDEPVLITPFRPDPGFDRLGPGGGFGPGGTNQFRRFWRTLPPPPTGGRRGDRTLMQVAAPVRDTNGVVRGALALVIDPDMEFSKILSVARSGDSGETYAFDQTGLLLSDSRFDAQLHQLGLLNATNASSALYLRLHDPGGNLTTGYQPTNADPSTRPLILMAANAVDGVDGVEVEPFRDYRGVPVVGAWRWRWPGPCCLRAWRARFRRPSTPGNASARRSN